MNFCNLLKRMVIYVFDGQKDKLGLLNEIDNEHSINESSGEDILITPKIINTFLRNHGLNKELRAKHLFAFGIGTVVTGFYMQWNLGLGMTGPYGVLAAMLVVFWFYLTFFSVLARFSVNYPYAGGPYAYARQGLGSFGGYLAGAATTLQFVCASSLVLIIVRKYLSLIYPELPGDYLALGVFALLITIHITSVWFSGIVQIFLTGSALSGIVLFFIGTYHTVDINNYFTTTPVIFGGLRGILGALPAVMWFYLGMEGITMSAEETRKPQHDLPLSLMSGLGTAFLLSLGVLYFGIVSVDWSHLKTVDFPLVYILSQVQRQDEVLLATFALINIVAFFASLHGLINGYSRQAYALSRAGYLPNFLSRMKTKHQIPFLAVVVPGLFSITISFIGSFQTVAVLTLFSAMLMYLLVIISYLRIRKPKPEIFYRSSALRHPFVLMVSLGLVIIGQISLIYQYLASVWIILIIYSGVVLYYYFWAGKNVRNEAPEENAAISTQNKVRIEVK